MSEIITTQDKRVDEIVDLAEKQRAGLAPKVTPETDEAPAPKKKTQKKSGTGKGKSSKK